MSRRNACAFQGSAASYGGKKTVIEAVNDFVPWYKSNIADFYTFWYRQFLPIFKKCKKRHRTTLQKEIHVIVAFYGKYNYTTGRAG